ncbi:hypothetical protein HDU96_001667, partial [Phlyctochytrium bullatum]
MVKIPSYRYRVGKRYNGTRRRTLREHKFKEKSAKEEEDKMRRQHKPLTSFFLPKSKKATTTDFKPTSDKAFSMPLTADSALISSYDTPFIGTSDTLDLVEEYLTATEMDVDPFPLPRNGATAELSSNLPVSPDADNNHNKSEEGNGGEDMHKDDTMDIYISFISDSSAFEDSMAFANQKHILESYSMEKNTHDDHEHISGQPPTYIQRL